MINLQHLFSWILIVKNPGPRDPALVSPQLPALRAYSSESGVEVTLDSEWNDGTANSLGPGPTSGPLGLQPGFLLVELTARREGGPGFQC